MSYKGKFTPLNESKYHGDPSCITFRSLWERKFMIYLDQAPHILEWSSESVVIPYVYSIDHKWHRYYPDFRVMTLAGETQIIEIKPKKQCAPPNPKRKKTKSYRKEQYAFIKNQNKWKYAENYCNQRGWIFKVITEEDIFGVKKLGNKG